jgi:IS1 family transposase
MHAETDDGSEFPMQRTCKELTYIAYTLRKATLPSFKGFFSRSRKRFARLCIKLEKSLIQHALSAL